LINSAEAYLNLSLQYYKVGQFEQCIEASKSALNLKPDYAPAYNNICSAHNMLAQYDLAVEACEKALAIDPGNSLARGNLKRALDQKQIHQ